MKIYTQLCLTLVLASVAVAADQDQAKRSPKAERTAISKRREILAEIKQLKDHEWAGEYYSGDGLGVNTSLVLAPRSGYVFEWHGCLGLYDRNFGPVAWTNGQIRLAFTFENDRKGFQGIGPNLIPVSWESRRYLIPADDVVGFCNKINEGSEPRQGAHGSYLLCRGDEEKKVSGFPKVPEQYQEYLLPKPVEATIVSIGTYSTRPSIAKWKFKDTPVTINAGTHQGLRVGMELAVTEPRDVVESVKISKVENDQAEGIMVQIGEDAGGPKSGWRLSTRSPWNK